MQYIEAPFEYTGDKPSVFLAGGITGAAEWQSRLIAKLCGTSWVVLNPRRQDFPMDDPDVGKDQIKWEHRHLKRASIVAFWFPSETLCPITLYELGTATTMDKPILVGTHPDYARCFDVQVQLGLARPEIEIVDNLDKLTEQIIAAEPTNNADIVPPRKETTPCVH